MKRLVSLLLLAALVAGCDGRRQSRVAPDAVDVGAGAGAPAVQAVEADYDCADQSVIHAVYQGETANLTMAGQTIAMARQPSADGSRYVGGGRQWWIKAAGGREDAILAAFVGQEAVASRELGRCTRRAPGAAKPQPPVIPVEAPACRSGDLQLTRQEADAGAGQRFVVYAFVNSSAAACSLKGYPTLVLFDSTGRTLDGVRSVQSETGGGVSSGPPMAVNLEPRGRAVFYVTYTGIQATDAPCLEATRIQVTPPGNSQAIELADTLNPCTGEVRLSPVRTPERVGSGPAFY